MSFKLLLVNPNAHICSAWREAFAELPDVTIAHSRFESLAEFDCIVSPANSFGLMDGGVDYAIIRFFGGKLMRDVQQHIIQEYLGEQPVGTSFLIETGHPKHPWLAHTPTMRVPMEISRTDNAYLAMWAFLRAIHHHNRENETPIKSVVCTGLGTGVGRVPAREAARQMALAYRNFLDPPSYIDWRYADQRQLNIRYGGDMGLHIPPME